MPKIERESDIEGYFVRRVKELGGEVRKVKWIGRRNAPDRFVMLNGKTAFVELKRPGKLPTAAQQRELDRLRFHDVFAEWASCKDHIDTILNWMMG